MTDTTLIVPLADPSSAANILAMMLAQLIAKVDSDEQQTLLCLFINAYNVELTAYQHAFDNVFTREFMAAGGVADEPLVAWHAV